VRGDLGEGDALRPAAGAPALDPSWLDEVVKRAASRWMGVRAAGRGRLTADEVRRRGLRGPLARAAGVSDDARTEDPLYRELGFEPVLGSEGDSLARALVRAREARAAIALAAGALEAAASGSIVSTSARPDAAPVVEGPRGPLCGRRTETGWGLSAPGGEAAREAAAAAMAGHEWSAALVVLASFDLSPWEVAG